MPAHYRHDLCLRFAHCEMHATHYALCRAGMIVLHKSVQDASLAVPCPVIAFQKKTPGVAEPPWLDYQTTGQFRCFNSHGLPQIACLAVRSIVRCKDWLERADKFCKAPPRQNLAQGRDFLVKPGDIGRR